MVNLVFTGRDLRAFGDVRQRALVVVCLNMRVYWPRMTSYIYMCDNQFKFKSTYMIKMIFLMIKGIHNYYF